jgi:hypothetical protein
MLNDGMGGVYFLRHDFRGPGFGRQFMTIHHGLSFGGTAGAVGPISPIGTSRRVAQRGAANLRMGGRRDSLDGHTAIDDDIVVHNRGIIDDGGSLINVVDFTRGQQAAAQVAVREITNSDKVEVIRTQSEIKAH